MTQSTRSKLVTRRTYCRPKEDGSYESWTEVCLRIKAHQRWLWERSLGRDLSPGENMELFDLFDLMLSRRGLPSGRILWMGGTAQARKTEIAMFNCSFLEVRDVYSAVDAFYLLLNGCGVGFKPVKGLLNGFAKPVAVEVIRSSSTKDKDHPTNRATTYVEHGKTVWHLTVGDSGKAWAKAFGKLLAMKDAVDIVRLDFSRIRRAGVLLKGYGWLSSGDEQIAKAFIQICHILSERADQLLDEIDITDLINLIGTTLTSRRSAEIAMLDANNPEAERFANIKNEYWLHAPWRSQSNNSLVFYSRPSKLELRGIFAEMLANGGSEPGFYNGEIARCRAPWFSGTNPCGEILLADGGLCNLAEFNIGAYAQDFEVARRDIKLLARANFRQTCVRLKDGVLSEKWHETQEFLRLCGVGLTGIVDWLDRSGGGDDPAHRLQLLREDARQAAIEMARQLGLPTPKAITTVKPSGTLGKLMDASEGIHRAPGRYVFNWIKFGKNDPTIQKLIDAGYEVKDDPTSINNVIACIPVDNGPGKWFNCDGEGKFINAETALEQLERYKLLMDNYVDHNASITVSYSPEEVSGIVEWLHKNWDSYVGVSFILRQDHSKSAEELGHPYLPQEVVRVSDYIDYYQKLKPIDFDGGDLLDMEECEGGACPVR